MIHKKIFLYISHINGYISSSTNYILDPVTKKYYIDYEHKNNKKLEEKSEFNEAYKGKNYSLGSDITGIKNVGNNCYLNSGLQILARCEKFVEKIQKFYDTKFPFIVSLYNAFQQLLSGNVYDPTNFIKYFCSINPEFKEGEQSCSQNFIRTVLNSVNNEIKSTSTKSGCIYSYNSYKPVSNEKMAYDLYIKANNIFPESEAISLFSGILKSHSVGECKYCKTTFDNYTFCYFIDQNMYLDSISEDQCKFSKVIRENLASNNAKMDCEKCKGKYNVRNTYQIKEENKLVKLPEILIFTIERYLNGTNNIQIKPDEKIDLKDYIDPQLKGEKTEYELFAINIRFGGSKNFGHEICQVKIKGYWYEFDDRNASPKKNTHHGSSYGLFYKRIWNLVYLIK